MGTWIDQPYSKNQIVEFDGTAYICLVTFGNDNQAATPPEAPDRWAVFVNSGVTGATGPSGEPGPAGGSVSLKGQLVEWPPTTEPNFGDMWLVVSPLPAGIPLELNAIPGDGIAWIESDGSGIWFNAGPFRGPSGPIGPTGPAGPAGAQGIQGARGSTGVTGATGPIGITGPTGVSGPTGPTGPVGATGLRGPAGDNASNFVLSVNNQTGVVTLQTDDIVLDTEFTVLSVDQGDLTANTVIPAGTPLTTIIKRMLQKRVPATYSPPTLGISSTISGGTIEYGTTISTTLSLTWTKRDGGDPTQFRYRQNNQTIQTLSGVTPPASYTVPAFDLTSAVTFNAAADYAAGPVKLDNFNDPTLPSLPSGTASSSSITFTPGNKRYYGCLPDDELTNALVLALPTSDEPIDNSASPPIGSGSDFTASRNITRDFNPEGQYIYFAWPASLEVGTLSFKVGGLPTSGWVKTTLDLRNEQLFNIPAKNSIPSIPYVVYRSQNKINGSNVSVQVTG